MRGRVWDQGARPEEQDDEERGDCVRPGGGGAMREGGAGIFGQEGKGEALDDAGKRELDIDDDFIQLDATGRGRFHDASRNGSRREVSTL